MASAGRPGDVVTYHWAGASDIGRNHELNEDAVVPDGTGSGEGPVVVAVADGLGGHPAGEVASRLAVAAVAASSPDLPAVELVAAAQGRVRDHIVEAIDEHPALFLMATTLTLACLRPDGLVEVGHVGDSRAYVGNGVELLQVTDDHTVAMDLVRSGKLAADEAEDHPGWHTISSSIGWEPCHADTKELPLEPGERQLLCSDGLSNMVRHDDISELLFTGPPAEAASALIAAANEAGGADNITVVVVEVAA